MLQGRLFGSKVLRPEGTVQLQDKTLDPKDDVRPQGLLLQRPGQTMAAGDLAQAASQVWGSA